MLSICTFTGVDAKTDLGRVVEMSRKYPFLEFGILLSMSPEDKDARYMSPSIIKEIMSFLYGNAVNTALHLCGGAVQEFLVGNKQITTLADLAGRVQLNFNADKSLFNIQALDAIFKGREPKKIITQHRPGNFSLSSVVSAPNHQVLYDLSAGRGVMAESWDDAFTNKHTGFAGGLGPDYIAEQIVLIEKASEGQNCWIDMETRIRSNGYLDLNQCEAVADYVKPFMSKSLDDRYALLGKTKFL